MKVKVLKWKAFDKAWLDENEKKIPRPVIASQRDWSWTEELPANIIIIGVIVVVITIAILIILTKMELRIPAHSAAIPISHAKALEVEVVKLRNLSLVSFNH